MSETIYEFRKDERGYDLGCSRCKMEPAQTTETDILGEPERLCPFCYESELGTILRNPSGRENVQLARAICQGLNVLLNRLTPNVQEINGTARSAVPTCLGWTE